MKAPTISLTWKSALAIYGILELHDNEGDLEPTEVAAIKELQTKLAKHTRTISRATNQENSWWLELDPKEREQRIALLDMVPMSIRRAAVDL